MAWELVFSVFLSNLTLDERYLGFENANLDKLITDTRLLHIVV